MFTIFFIFLDIARNHVIPRSAEKYTSYKETANKGLSSPITPDASIMIVKIMTSDNDSTTKLSKRPGKWIFPPSRTPISSKKIDMNGPLCSIARDVNYDHTWTEKLHRKIN